MAVHEAGHAFDLVVPVMALLAQLLRRFAEDFVPEVPRAAVHVLPGQTCVQQVHCQGSARAHAPSMGRTWPMARTGLSWVMTSAPRSEERRVGREAG